MSRKSIILGACLLAAPTYFPAVKLIARLEDPALSHAQQSVQVVLTADPADCSFQFNPTGVSQYTSTCDLAKAALARNSVVYSHEEAAPGTAAAIHIGDRTIDVKTPGFARELGA